MYKPDPHYLVIQKVIQGIETFDDGWNSAKNEWEFEGIGILWIWKWHKLYLCI